MVVTVFTAVTGGKDFPREDIKCFNNYSKFIKPVLNAKIYKILAHQYVNSEYSIWIDGNIKLLVEPEKLVKEFLGDADIAVWKHFSRDCIYDEASQVKHFPFVEEQMAYYKSVGYLEHKGLGECNVVIRKHSQIVEYFNNYWWSEICRWSQRDQLSFPYVVSKFPNLKVRYVEGDPRKHEYFKWRGHLI